MAAEPCSPGHDGDGALRSDQERTIDFNPVHAIKSAAFHIKAGNINWPMAIYITLAHVWACIGLTYVASVQPKTLLWALALWPISLLGIGAGAHRLWSHRSYEAAAPVRCFLMLCNSVANQGSIFHWARNHRVHHTHSEKDGDPHNATRGFFFAHIGWLYLRKHPAVITAGKKLSLDDLHADKFVMFQKACDPWLAMTMCFLMPAAVATLGWGEGFWPALWVAGALRYCVCLHFTWLVNSAAHFFGTHPYDSHLQAAENPLVSLATIGEGWHNWHHKYPFDYAVSELGVTAQFNPTKLFIDGCARAGLVTNRKRATGVWERAKLARALRD